ncbi:MAG TPA: DUF72 domain-containing protein [Chryseosolibacter sp.]|nr:DUF72 domain-containing protein [Chryseosolibacter sp.]
MVSKYFSGLSGLQLPVPKYEYPPEHQHRSRLSYYATFLNSIEINSSFYKIPIGKTVGRWASSVPANFRFTFKLFKELTHCKFLEFNPDHIQKFIESINNVGEKQGCILVQFPPSLTTSSIHRFESLLKHIRNTPGAREWKIAVEFRNNAWYQGEVFDILDACNALLVIQDNPKSATPFNAPISNSVYIRFHGPTGNYRGGYSDEFLSEYATYIRDWINEGKEVYTYFNNTAGDAYNNLVSLNRMMDEHSIQGYNK